MTRILQPRLYLVVLAGGQSTRARGSDSSAPKQFREVAGEMLFVHGLRELARAPGVVRVVLVVPEAWRPTAEAALAGTELPVPLSLAAAGRHRTASAWHALETLAELDQHARPEPGDLVAVHDAARPFASRHLLNRLARAAARHGAAVPGVPVPDTVIQLDAAEDGELDESPVAAYLDRGRLVAVQTPQVARWRDLHAAHAWAAAEERSFTDDGGLVAERGLRPVVVMGERGNWKITTEEDWQRAAALLRRESVL
jgi:2-C-methyl-D-erythritol 4-phosphate cytidylyltransferase/2-C-methyl-D-erythritol 2,4-cyclodiphosphate synthase